jgi:twinkle protein
VPPEEPWSTGIEGLDELYRPSRRRLTVVTGIPGHGKTTLIADIVCNLVQKHALVIAIASFEDDIRETLVPRLRQWFLGKDQKFADADQIEAADRWIARHLVFIQPPESSIDTPSVEWFIERAEAAVTRYGASFLVLDPWNEVDHTGRPADVTQTEYVGVMLTRLRRSAKTKGYHLLIAAHPTKLMKGSNGKYPPPTGYQISDSANWVNKPDSGLTIYRNPENVVEIHSWKCRRDGLIGSLGKRSFRFNSQTGRYALDDASDIF